MSDGNWRGSNRGPSRGNRGVSSRGRGVNRGGPQRGNDRNDNGGFQGNNNNFQSQQSNGDNGGGNFQQSNRGNFQQQHQSGGGGFDLQRGSNRGFDSTRSRGRGNRGRGFQSGAGQSRGGGFNQNQQQGNRPAQDGEFMHIPHNMKDNFKNIIASLWNPSSKGLDLSNISMSISSKMSNFKGANFQNKAFCKEIFEIIRGNCADLESLDISNNNLTSLVPFRFLYQYAPNLKNLCLENNRLDSLTELSNFDGYKDKLFEIILRNNPSTASIHPGLYNYHIRSRFPNLKLLDGKEVSRTVLNFSIPDFIRAGQLPEHRPSCSSSPALLEQTIGFLTAYFNAYDSNRQNIIDSYNANAIFSFSLYPSSVQTPTEGDFDHNLLNMKGEDPKRLNLVANSKLNIVLFLEKLPATKHRMTDMTVDSFEVPARGTRFLQVQVRGQFIQEGKFGRNFFRTFLLGPAENASWPFTIHHDMLVFGDGTPLSLDTFDTVQESNYIPTEPQGNFDFSNQLVQMAQAVVQNTNVDMNTAQRALENANWNVEEAINLIRRSN